MNDVWTIRATLDWCEGYLARAQDVNPRVSAQHLLSFATGLSRIELYAHHDRPLSPDERATLRAAAEALLRAGARQVSAAVLARTPPL